MTVILPPLGASIEEIDTPALVLDLPIVEANIETMHRFFRNRPAKVRNVTKGHKCPALAQRQMTTQGSIPFALCCAKLSEAEVMIDAGARHVRMIEQVVGKAKIERLMGLARRAQVIALVDDPGNLDSLAAAAEHHRVRLDVLVEVEIGLNRCGVPPGKPTLALTERIMRTPSLRFAGLSAHEGTIAIAEREARIARTRERVQRLLDTRQDLERAGIPVEICGAGATTTWNIAGAMEGITEIDPGSYVLMDNGLAEALPDLEFSLALAIHATVISRPTRDRAVIDCGHKAIGRAGDGGMPLVAWPPGATVNRLNSEHGILDLSAEATNLRVGDRVKLIPRYHGSAVIAHDHFIGVRDDRVECVWQIAARGSHQ
jgi:D-serine deaminase-like pyridoxal phosphate-dependent protein